MSESSLDAASNETHSILIVDDDASVRDVISVLLKEEGYACTCVESAEAALSQLEGTETHLVNNYEWRDLALVFTVANMGKVPFVGHAWLPPALAVTCNGTALALHEGNVPAGPCLVPGNA